jgi:nucleoside-specific outer membrane channel protein Tsx
MTYEFGEDDTESYLIGPGFDLAIPGFDYFQLNFYNRHSEGDRPGDNIWQVTPVWSYTIPVGDSDVLIDGFMDWVVDNDVNSKGEYHANLHFNPQVKYDLGKALNLGAKQLYVGVEYDYWKNKYGIEDSQGFKTDQSVTSFLVKVHF